MFYKQAMSFLYHTCNYTVRCLCQCPPNLACFKIRTLEQGMPQELSEGERAIIFRLPVVDGRLIVNSGLFNDHEEK